MEDAEEDGELGIQHSHSKGSHGEVESKLRAAAAPARPCSSRLANSAMLQQSSDRLPGSLSTLHISQYLYGGIRGRPGLLGTRVPHRPVRASLRS